MRKGLRWRFLMVAGLVVVALWQLYPTWKFLTLSPEERDALSKDELYDLQRRAINLGLDLRGGMNIVLEVDKSGLSEEEAQDAVDRALEIIRNRVDKFGVFEPSIQKEGENRIAVQLPGVEQERARALIGRTAQLEFRLLPEQEEMNDVYMAIDRALARADAGEAMAADTAEALLDTLLLESRPFSSYLRVLRTRDVAVRRDDVFAVEALLARPEAQAAIPDDKEILWGREEEEQGISYRPIYVMRREPELTGAALADARMEIGQSGGSRLANQPYVSLRMTQQAAGRFRTLTGANIGRKLAIVLDGVVQSAPVIRERIPRGVASITGIATVEEAKDLSIILRAGALPAPVRIIDARFVGPTLGADSIRMGIRAAIWGGIIVLVFMLAYYSLSGTLADMALVLNLLFLLAALSAFDATLTLPGIAGIVLTIGIAVDANVLIFERIREELASGKTIRASIDAGYSRAFRTILDANVTTLLTALILYWFGTGPVKGFAVTLSIGIVVSFVTAIFITRMIFDFVTSQWEVSRLRI
jgi:SecD/SecF fusion protein